MGRTPPAAVLQRRVAAWLASLRVSAGVTQEEMASKLAMATRNLQRLESGSQNLTLQTVERFARALGVPSETAFPIVGDRQRRGPSDLHVVPAAAEGRAPRAVPLFSLGAAAGYVRSGRSAAAIGWTLLPGTADQPAPSRSERRMFIAQVSGRSMEPLIADRSWSLFSPVSEVPEGAIGLFELRRRGDRDNGGSHVVKRLARRERNAVVLASVNPSFAPITIEAAKGASVRAVARWVRVVSAR